MGLLVQHLLGISRWSSINQDWGLSKHGVLGIGTLQIRNLGQATYSAVETDSVIEGLAR